jgi:uncharacterized DUF497 family protein
VNFSWNEDKNEQLKKSRNISFERVIIAIQNNDILDVLENPKNDKYRDQILIIVDIENYAFVVPAVKGKDGYFLKTIFPSRKYIKKYLSGARRKL